MPSYTLAIMLDLTVAHLNEPTACTTDVAAIMLNVELAVEGTQHQGPGKVVFQHVMTGSTGRLTSRA